MRVAYVCTDPGVPVFGRKGASVHVQEVVAALERVGSSVELFARRLGDTAPPGLQAIRVHRLPKAPRGLGPAERERRAREVNGALRERLEAAGPWDAIYERFSLWSFAALELARERGIPGILEVNAPLIAEQALHRGLVDRAAAEEVARRALAAASAVVAVSRGVADWLEEFPAARGRIHVIPNGVHPGRFLPARRDPARPFSVGFVGSLKPWHGVGLLAEAFARLHARDPRVQLVVVGDGPERERLQRDLGARGLTACARLAGAVPPAVVPAWLARMDAGVAPYPMASGFYFSPLKVLEYMAAGVPVVASAIGQIPELLDAGRCGILCPPGDVEALAEALDALRRDPALRQRLGAAGHEAALRRHSWDAVVQAILERAGLAVGAAERRAGCI
jgi:glycosyltransferase involved in cell wall biosynthesis